MKGFKILSVKGICLIVVLFFIVQPKSKDNSSAANEEFTVLTGPYLGQNPPGIVPEIFGAGVIDNNQRVFAITFSPDGKECFYTLSFRTNMIMTTKEIDGVWIKPAVPELTGRHFDFEPHITPDGSRIIFGSARPLPGTSVSGEPHQWYADKIKDGWSDPEPLGLPFNDIFCMYVSAANNGNIYFTGDDGIYISEFCEGAYNTPEKLDSNINYLNYAAHPFIAPNESYLIYDGWPTEKSQDLFISFKNSKGSWTKSIPFDSTINSDWNDLMPFISRDGKYFFFSRLISDSEANIYWVDAKIIEDYKPTILEISSGTDVTIDGVLQAGEWEDAKTAHFGVDDIIDVTVYFKHDSSNLLAAYSYQFPGEDETFCPELVFDINNDKGTGWQSEDWWFHVSCSNCDVQGKYDDYGNCSIIRPDWEGVRNFNCAQKPISPLNFFELRIPLTKLGINMGDTVGLGIRVIHDDDLYTLWPKSMSIDNPATWGTAALNP